MISTATAGGTVTNYSNRFTLTGMTGVFSAAVQTALKTVTGTAGPATVNNIAQAAPPPGQAATADEGVYATPYNDQIGLTRYAPMQPVPPTAITATNTAPLWPTSSVVLATTFLPIPSIQTTITQAQTFSVASHPNTVSSIPSFHVGQQLTFYRPRRRLSPWMTCRGSSIAGKTESTSF